MSGFRPNRLGEQRATRFGYAPGRAHDPTVNTARVNGFIPSSHSNPSEYFETSRPVPSSSASGTSANILDSHPLLKAYDAQLKGSITANDRLYAYEPAIRNKDLRVIVKILDSTRKRLRGVGVIDDLLNRFKLAFKQTELDAIAQSRSSYPDAYQTHYSLILPVAKKAMVCEGLMPTSHRDYCMSLAAKMTTDDGRVTKFAQMSSADRATTINSAEAYNALIAAYPDARQAELITQMTKAEKDKVVRMRAARDFAGMQKLFGQVEARLGKKVKEEEPEVDEAVDTELISEDVALVPVEEELSYMLYYAAGGVAVVGVLAYYWFVIRKPKG